MEDCSTAVVIAFAVVVAAVILVDVVFSVEKVVIRNVRRNGSILQ